MPLDTPLRSMANAVIGVLGTSVTITYNTAGAYNTATGTATPTTSTASVSAAISMYDTMEVGGLIESGDMKVCIPAVGVTEPKQDDTVTFNSVVYQIVRVETHYASDLAAAYTLQVRR